MHRSLALVPLSLVLLAACSAAAPSPKPSVTAVVPNIVPILASSEVAKGPNRFLFALTDRANKLVAAPDVSVHLRFYDDAAGKDTVAFEADSRFLWAIEGERGLYVANVTFPRAGRWGTRFDATFPDGRTETVRADYDVRETASTPAIGSAVPSVDTPTSADVGGDLKAVSTDKAPDPRFYETSIADALAAGKPFVVAFATPAFCQTQLCGPTLDTVKAVAMSYPDMTFINVEPYVMAMNAGSLQPVLSAQGALQPAPWTTAWGLVSEPLIAVVDGGGKMRAKFEGVIGADELRSALDAL